MLLKIVVAFLSLAGTAAQTSAPPAAARVAPAAPGAEAEKAAFAAALTEFQAQQYSIALAGFKQLIAQNPASEAYKKFGAEAALDSGDANFALQILPALETAHHQDWQTRLLLARAYQQTVDQPGHAGKRDEEIDAVTRMHESGDDPKLASLRDFLLETVRQDGKTIQIYPAFVPWGPDKVSLIARVYDASGGQEQRLTLETDETDQPNFALQNPAAAAAGERAYTLDGYGPEEKAGGTTYQTHYTYAFYVGRPTYDVVRARILAIAAAKASPLTGRRGPVE